MDSPFTIALDEADRILGRPYQRDFFAMLRSWHNARAEPLAPWEQVDLALVISTEPYVLIDRADQSPFNVTPPVELRTFPREALDTLNERYGTGLDRSKLDQLFELLNGHPYLTRLAFYRIVTGDVADLKTLLEHAPSPEGPFGDHLRDKLIRLQYHAGLTAAMHRLCTGGPPPSEDDFHRLHGVGLVSRQNGKIVPANLLYARFFKSIR